MKDLSMAQIINLTCEKFWLRVKKTDGCWLWEGGMKDNGYGDFYMGHRKKMTAHRYSWTYHNGEIPTGLLVLHKCDIRNCVNPDHLYIGTQQDNMDDMVRRNRQGNTSGERNSLAKLTNLQVAEIRKKYEENNEWGMQAKLAKEYGVAPVTINHIVNRRRWPTKKQTPCPTRESAPSSCGVK